MKSNYNGIAPYYDLLAGLVFGNAIIEAQKQLLPFIKPHSTVLIVGGGTGWILEEISATHEGLQITYVESSEKMMKLSTKRRIGNNQVKFLNQTIQDVCLTTKFQVVITPFVLDNFSPETTADIFRKIDCCLLPGAMWLLSDFQVSPKGHIWQKAMLKAMYFFFRLVCQIEAKNLPDLPGLFKKYRYNKHFSSKLFSGFIGATVYSKPD